jgi:hypothetical protein
MESNTYGKKKCFLKMQLKNRLRWLFIGGIAIELQPTEPIFEKYPHLREKGGIADAQNTPLGLC